MSLNIEPGVPMPGTLSLIFVPAAEPGFNPEEPQKAILNGETAVHVQCHLLGGTYTGVTTDVPQIRKTRACSKDPYYVDGEKEVTIGGIQVVYNPQELGSSLSKPYATLVEGTRWWRVERRGIDGQEEVDDGEVVHTNLVKVTHANEPYSEEAGAEHYAEIWMAYQGTGHKNVVVGGVVPPAPAWVASTVYLLGSRVTASGTTLEAINGGTSGSTLPTPPGTGLTVVDGTVEWLQVD